MCFSNFKSSLSYWFYKLATSAMILVILNFNCWHFNLLFFESSKNTLHCPQLIQNMVEYSKSVKVQEICVLNCSKHKFWLKILVWEQNSNNPKNTLKIYIKTHTEIHELITCQQAYFTWMFYHMKNCEWLFIKSIWMHVAYTIILIFITIVLCYIYCQGFFSFFSEFLDPFLTEYNS